MIVLITHNATLREGLFSFLRERGYLVSVPEHRQDAMVMVQGALSEGGGVGYV